LISNGFLTGFELVCIQFVLISHRFRIDFVLISYRFRIEFVLGPIHILLISHWGPLISVKFVLVLYWGLFICIEFELGSVDFF